MTHPNPEAQGQQAETLKRERFAGHDRGVVIINDGYGNFSERPMTQAELLARKPAAEIQDRIYEFANYAGVCYATIWRLIADTIHKALNDDGECEVCENGKCTAKTGCVACSHAEPAPTAQADVPSDEPIQIAREALESVRSLPQVSGSFAANKVISEAIDLLSNIAPATTALAERQQSLGPEINAVLAKHQRELYEDVSSDRGALAAPPTEPEVDALREDALAYLALAEKATPGPWSAHDGERKFKMPGGCNEDGSIKWREEVVCACGCVTSDHVAVAFAVGAEDEDHTLGEGVDRPQKAKNAAFIAASHTAAQIIRRLLDALSERTVRAEASSPPSQINPSAVASSVAVAAAREQPGLDPFSDVRDALYWLDGHSCQPDREDICGICQAISLLKAARDAGPAAVAQGEARDAARYRWLAGHAESITGLRIDWFSKKTKWGEREETLDAAIDAALAAGALSSAEGHGHYD